jgi:hypothetical protein
MTKNRGVSMKMPNLNIGKLEVGTWIKADPIHCHQRLEKNKLIDAVRACSEDGLKTEVKFKFNPNELEFFFDHAIDHLPGMLEVNGMRQLSLAVAHLVYKVPMNYVALLGWLKVRFYSYGDLNVETRANVDLVETRFTKFKKIYVFTGIMHQNGIKLMRVDGQLIMMHPLLADKTRNMKIKIDDPEQRIAGFSW